MPVIHFWLAHWTETVQLVQQHVVLVAVSTLAAIIVGVPGGVLAARRPRIGRTVLIVAGAAQTVPSLALLGFLLPIPFVGGIGPRAALVALFVYALLPILRTTVNGIRNVDPDVIEAGIAMGMTRRQLLWLVEFPLALPSIITGVRVATVIGVGTATIAAAIGAGGLGEYIFRGLAMVDTTTILAGAVPAAMLALLADGLLAWLEHRIRAGRAGAAGVAQAATAAALLALITITGYATTGKDVVVVGSKNFTEQVILGELVAQAIELEGDVQVTRKLNLGGTFVCDRAIRAGDLDTYVEYTGTAVTAVFHERVPNDSRLAFDRARELYAHAGVTALDPLGFNNTFAILVRSADAQALGLRTIEDLRKVDGWTPGFGYEFLQREDGYPGLLRAYGLRFKSQPRAMDLALIYRALSNGQVDVIAGDATSALITPLRLTALEDNRRYFPPYDAVPLVRTAALLRYPAVGRALARLAGRVSDRDMRAMNAAVDIDRRDVRTVVQEFLASLARS
jgi:osmoprotectant transport system permease protein